jgi:hypothetical protein
MPVTDKSARMRMIAMMIAGCPGSASSVTEYTVEAYLISVEDVPTDILGAACRSYLKPPARQYAPSGSELAERCEMMMPHERDPNDVRDMRNLVTYPIGGEPPEGMVPAGILSIDFGDRRGRINMTRLSHKEQERVMHGATPPKTITVGSVPTLRRMGK